MGPHAAETGNMTGSLTSVRTLPVAHLRLAALLALGTAVFLVGWLVIGRGDDDTPAPTAASLTSEAELRDFAASADHPVYWAGRRDGHTYELTRTSDGRVFVRYLPEGVDPGDPRPNFLTVGTYPRQNAFAELRRASNANGAVTRKLPNSGLAVYNRASRSVYLGYPDARYQVEVYHPDAEMARSLILAGQVRPIR